MNGDDPAILAVVPPWRGHAVQVLALTAELAARGHRVVVAAAPDAAGWVDLGSCTLVPWDPRRAADGETLSQASRRTWRAACEAPGILAAQKHLVRLLVEWYVPIYRSLDLLVRDTAPRLMLIDWTLTAALDVAGEAAIPCVVQSRFLGDFVTHARGQPRFGTPYPERMSAGQRLANALLPLVQVPRFAGLTTKLLTARRRCGVAADLKSRFRAAMLVVGAAPVLETGRSLPPGVRVVGPILPRDDPPPSPALRGWLDRQRPESVIYAGFGTLVIPDRDQLSALAAALGRTGRPVLWSTPAFPRQALPALPPWFRVEDDVPQRAVLSHPSVGLFVSHAGRNSANEALIAGRPMLAVPFFGDQFYNAARLADAGVAVVVGKRQLGTAALDGALAALLEDPVPARRAARIASGMSRDEGRERAADLVEAQLQVRPAAARVTASSSASGGTRA